jgi:ribosomal protein S18 acetylase RimI-like enzyme
MDEAPVGKRADAGRVPLVADRAGRPPPREGEEAAGFAVTRQILDEAELLLFAISPQYRRRGLGGILLKNLLEESEGKGVASMLEMRAGNPAEFLYRNHGFLPIGNAPTIIAALMAQDWTPSLSGATITARICEIQTIHNIMHRRRKILQRYS